MDRVPGLLVAAPSSGSGKTTVVCALAAALGARGLDVRLFKAGPDYLDPTWHRAVTRRPTRNLDGWMMGPEALARSFVRGARGGDLALVEGVMGLFDGRDPRTLEGSGAELALRLGLPVVLVVDASGMARTAAAVVEGLARHVAGVRVTGVIFNRVGGPGHTRILAEAMEAVPGVRVLGGLPARPDLAVPERHLGLVTAETAARPGWREALAAWATDHLDLAGLLALAVEATVPATTPAPPLSPEGRPVRIGVARDAAFHFYYEDNLEYLEEAGATIVPFSPLADASLPADLDGVYLGGGYPEAWADTLAANAGMRTALRTFRGPIYAECGGLMYLGEALDDRPMVGALPIRTRMGPGLRALGYREVEARVDTPLGPAGTRWRGHAFHWAELEGAPGVAPAFRATGWGVEEDEGWMRGNVLGTWVHAHFGSNPALARHFVEACRAWRGR